MKLKRVFAIYLRQLFLLKDNPTRFINIFVWIVLDVILWGFITKYLNTVGDTSFSFVPQLLGAVIFWDFLTRIQQGIMLAFLEDVWSQNFLNLFASPLTLKEYVCGLIVTSITTSTAGLLAMLLLAWLFFGYSIVPFGFHLISLIGILFIFGLSLGIFTSGIVLRFGPSAEWIAWPIPFIIAPFVGIYYPVATLPEFVQPISMILPASYAFEGMRSILLSGVVSIQGLLTGAGLACIFLVLASIFFVRIYRYVLRSGMITKFNVESL